MGSSSFLPCFLLFSYIFTPTETTPLRFSIRNKHEITSPMTSDEEEGLGDTSVGDGSDSTTDHEDYHQDDMPVVSDDDDVEEVWADDF